MASFDHLVLLDFAGGTWCLFGFGRHREAYLSCLEIENLQFKKDEGVPSIFDLSILEVMLAGWLDVEGGAGRDESEIQIHVTNYQDENK